MDGIGGYRAWRWIFIIEGTSCPPKDSADCGTGLLTIAVAVVAVMLLPDWPANARFLDERERETLASVLADDNKELLEDESSKVVLLQVLVDPKMWFT